MVEIMIALGLFIIIFGIKITELEERIKELENKNK